MSITLAQTRLFEHTQAYKQALRNLTPLNPPTPGASSALPNDAGRSAKAMRTRDRRFGPTKHSPSAPQNAKS